MNPQTSLSRHTRRSRPTVSGVLVAAFGLLAWLAPPLAADVIDDFSGPPKYNGILDPTGVFDYEIVDGQLKMSRPRQFGVHRQMWYWRTYAVPEDRWLEVRLDDVSASGYGVGTYITFLGSEVTYSLWHFRSNVLLLLKGWEDKYAKLVAESMPGGEDPVTLVLGLRREGASLKLLTKVVRRDSPSEVILESSFTDHAGPDPVLNVPEEDPRSSEDVVPPGLGPSVLVAVGMAELEGGGGRAEQVIDNFICSEDPVPVALGIRREGATQIGLDWQGAYVPFAAAIPEGPWAPCPEPITAGRSGFTLAMALGGPCRFFRLVRGWSTAASYEAGEPGAAWVAKAMGAGTPSLSYTYPVGHLRVRGTGGAQLDFALGDNNAASWWPKDCVASVDLVAWDGALEGQRFGLLLRVKPDKEVWYIKDGVPEQRYSGLLTFKRTGNPTESELVILGPGAKPLGTTRFAAVDPAKQYRLRFSAVGDQLTLQLFDLAQPEVVIQSCAVADGSVATGMVAFQGTMSANGKYDVTIDRFIVNGSTR